MARIYAGILGPLGFLTSLAHGVIHARSTEASLLTAWGSLIVFAVVGYLVGWIAGRIVEEAVSEHVSVELAERQTAENQEATASAT